MKNKLPRIHIKAKSMISKGANSLRKNKIVKTMVKKNPQLAGSIKKLVKNLLGEMKDIGQPNIIENPFNSLINPDMSVNFAEHINLLQDNKIYWYEKESSGTYKRHKDDPRLVALYLPQFHPFKENDEAWGKGFTEWTNVTASIPRFVGQQQPVLPSDLGFYDLRMPSIIKQQIELAKKYGIYGFQFYYYWFSGKKVMDLPINTILENKDWDFNFSICWANENWTRKWDGGDDEIIFEQKDMPEDPINFIKDVAPILNDKRYIHENGKPILTVYRVELLSDPKKYVDTWRKYFKKNFNKDLWLIGHTYLKEVNPIDFGFDVTMDFTPIGSLQPDLKPWVDDRKYLTEEFRKNRKLLDVNWAGEIIDFRFIAKQEIDNLKNNHNFYKTISPSWSNEARRKGNGGYTFYNHSPEIFTNWLDKILDYEINNKNKKSPIVFINSWNEWAESAMIEPSQHVGHNSLLRLAEILSRYSLNKENKELFPIYKLSYSKSAKLAVVIHLFYPEMWSDINKKLKNINVPFDIYISVPSWHNNIKIETVSKYHKNTNIVIVPNRGRDVLPFITIMNRVRKLDNYEYILKLHTKKSKHRSDGFAWQKDLLNQLLPSNIDNIVKILSRKSTGLVGPYGHLVSLSRHMGDNRDTIVKLVNSMTDRPYEDFIEDETMYPFVGSTMFWCRVDFLEPILDTYLVPSDFPSEKGQIDGTIAHAIERVLGKLLHKVSNKTMYTVDSRGRLSSVKDNDNYIDKYKFAD